MRKVLIPTKLDSIARDILVTHGRYAVIQDDKTPLAQQAAQHPDTYALIVRSEKVSADIIDAFPHLRVIVRAGAGFNTIDTKHARRRNIDVMNTPGANANAVAEEVVAMILADARHVVEADPSTRRGEWEKTKFMGNEIAGKTVGIVGLGNIGRLVARRLAGFDVKLLGFDPAIAAERAREIDVELCDLPTLFSQADIITLHVPETSETRKLVGESLLARARNGVTIVNCARAGIVDEDALRRLKPAKQIRFLTDVYPKDEPGPKAVADIADLMLPHLGASTREANWNAAKRSAEQLVDFDERGVTSYIVNRDIPEGLDRTYCTLANMISRLCRAIIGRHIQPKTLETSFYGSLEPFAEWLLVPIVAGMSDEFDSSLDHKGARKYLADMGVDYINRTPDPHKRFENSITVDMTGTSSLGQLTNVSIRGTVAEGEVMISRINEFDKLWFEPTGFTVMFLYDDRPGVLGNIGVHLAKAGINIEDVRNPHDARTNHSLAIMKVNQLVPEPVMAEITHSIAALASFNVKI